MKELLFNETSRTGRLIFRQLLHVMDSSLRYRFNDPFKLVRASGIQPGQTVLEVGCGSGFFTPVLSDIVGEKGQVESIDLHPMAIASTAQKIKDLGKRNVHIRKADGHQTDYPESAFDMIIVYGVVPAPVIDEIRLGAEMYRILKPGGILAVWTIAPFWSPKSLMKETSFSDSGKYHGVVKLQKPFSKENC